MIANEGVLCKDAIGDTSVEKNLRDDIEEFSSVEKHEFSTVLLEELEDLTDVASVHVLIHAS